MPPRDRGKECGLHTAPANMVMMYPRQLKERLEISRNRRDLPWFLKHVLQTYPYLRNENLDNLSDKERLDYAILLSQGRVYGWQQLLATLWDNPILRTSGNFMDEIWSKARNFTVYAAICELLRRKSDNSSMDEKAREDLENLLAGLQNGFDPVCEEPRFSGTDPVCEEPRFSGTDPKPSLPRSRVTLPSKKCDTKVPNRGGVSPALQAQDTIDYVTSREPSFLVPHEPATQLDVYVGTIELEWGSLDPCEVKFCHDLYIAVYSENVEQVERLIEWHENNLPNIRLGPEGDVALLEAVRCGNLAIVRLLLRVGLRNRDPPIDYVRSGATPLMIAAAKGNLEMMKLLVDHGSDVNVGVDIFGHISREGRECTPLHTAVRYADLPIVEYLLGQGANINAVTFQTQEVGGDTPLHIAIKMLYSREEDA